MKPGFLSRTPSLVLIPYPIAASLFAVTFLRRTPVYCTRLSVETLEWAGLFVHRLWSWLPKALHRRPGAAVLALLTATQINTGLAPAQVTSVTRRIQADVESIANAKSSAGDRDRAQADLLAVIGTPGGQDRFIVLFDNGDFAIRAGNWLENVQPLTIEDSVNACESAIGVLHSTKNSQLILAMAHAILRQ